jgi:hypothetical protein
MTGGVLGQRTMAWIGSAGRAMLAVLAAVAQELTSHGEHAACNSSEPPPIVATGIRTGRAQGESVGIF